MKKGGCQGLTPPLTLYLRAVRSPLGPFKKYARSGRGKGVYGALKGTSVSDELSKRSVEIKICVLGPDLAARGLSEKPLIDELKLVDYGGFVDLVEECSSVQSWL